MSSSGPVGIGVEKPARANQLRCREATTILLLFTGYAAYYFCRSDLSVAMPLLIEDLRRHGMSSNEGVIRLGTISSFGVLAYAVGKVFLTGLGDFWGGRRSFTIGLGGAIAFTLLFASGGAVSIFTIAWIGNRQIVGRRFADATVLRAADSFELARPWADKWPSLPSRSDELPPRWQRRSVREQIFG